MRIYSFETSIRQKIEKFGSRNVIQSRITDLKDKAHVSHMQIGAKGLIGFHRATTPQLFLVIRGKGWVRGETKERISISAGQAAYWEAGEWHESGTITGMMVIVIEIDADEFDPAEYMLELR